ncbi:aldo/keto reductase [Streptomyces sp. NBC_00882]|uniref:aldo/keto reductase n=1 Tax=Streptomyces TaxID=1883 RepID=UPI003863CC18|nr:aldo/keto reductase [Streptomyces canus]WSZ29501.1 aldo/keto reductase [Streptomyces sp. NBC_00882]WSZ63636.1 aldo/keto reductase [Streptomyces canus]
MRSTRLGRSGVAVTELAFGAAALGNLHTPVDDESAAATVDAAWEAGIRYFDTAPHYGLGLSEIRLGRALTGRPRGSFTVSTKVGRLLEPVDHPTGDDCAQGFAVPATHRRIWDFSADGILRSIDASLRRLGLDALDVVYLHDPDDHLEQALSEGYPALERLRSEGVVSAIGAGMNQSAALTRFVTETDVDAVLLAGRYTLLNHEAIGHLLPAAAARGTSVVIGGVFNSGLLAAPRPGATYDYAPASASLVQRAVDLQAATERHGVALRAAALQFPFGHPAVTSVLVGARSADEVRDAAAFLSQPLPAALWNDLLAAGHLPTGVPTPKRI